MSVHSAGSHGATRRPKENAKKYNNVALCSMHPMQTAILTGHALRVQVMRHHFAQCWVPRRNAATCVAQTEGATESVDNIEALLKAVPLEGATSTLNAWAILRFRGVDRKQYVCVISDAELRARVAGEWTETAENLSDAARAFMDAGGGEETPSKGGKRGTRGSLSVRFLLVFVCFVLVSFLILGSVLVLWCVKTNPPIIHCAVQLFAQTGLFL